MNRYYLIVALFVIMSSCISSQQIGDINMMSSRNISNNQESYVLLKSYAGGTKEEQKRAKKEKVLSLEAAINIVVRGTVGGEYLKNVKVFLVDKKYIAVEGDVWGIKDADQNFRGFKVGDRALYQDKSVLGEKYKKGKIVAIKDDKKLLFQPDGEGISEVEYKYLTRIQEEKASINERNSQTGTASVEQLKTPSEDTIISLKKGDKVEFQNDFFMSYQSGVIDEINNETATVKLKNGSTKKLKLERLKLIK